MKKFAAILLSVSLSLSMSSCIGNSDFNNPASPTLTEAPTSQHAPDAVPDTSNDPTHPYMEQLSESRYYQTFRVGTDYNYCIFDPLGEQVICEYVPVQPMLSMVGEKVVEILIPDASGNQTAQYYDVEQNVLSPVYPNFVAATKELVAYFDGDISGGKLIIKSIFIEDGFYQVHQLDTDKTATSVESASFGSRLLAFHLVGTSPLPPSFILLDDTPFDYFADYASVLKLTDDLFALASGTAGDSLSPAEYSDALGITDPTQKQWVADLLTYYFSYGALRGRENTLGYDLKDLNGDGTPELILLRDDYTVGALLTTVDGRPALVDSYWERKKCFIDAEGQLHVSGSNGADSTSHQIFKIAVDSATQELIAEFGTSGHEWIDGVAVLKYYKKVNGEKVWISEKEMQEICKLYPTPSISMTRDEAKLTYHPSSDDARMQLLLIAPPYRDALESLIPVYDALSGEPTYMRDVKDPYSATSLLGTGDYLSYAYVDLDGDGEKQIVINCPGGTLLLRHYEGRVYLYQFTFKSLYNLKTDGTYDFGYTAGDFVYGEKCIAFDGARLIEKEIFRIVNNSEFYLDNRQVTEAELLQYIESQPPKSDVLFAPIAFSWQYPVSSTDAIEIANEYWGFPDHRQEGACGTRLVLRVVLYDSPLEDQHKYKISLVRYAYPSGDSEGGVSYRKEVLESVYINAYTGTCTKMEAPPFDDGK